VVENLSPYCSSLTFSIQSSRVGENGERITRQRRLRENVELDEFVSAVRHKASLAFYFRNFLIPN